MTFRVRLVPEAQIDFDDAVDWYKQQKPSLGKDFVAEIRLVLRRIAANPNLHAKVYGDVRKAVVAVFPYIVLYLEDGGEVIVIAVFHTSRDPAIWQARV